MLTTRDIMKQVADKLEDEHDMDVSLRTDGGLCLCSPRWTLLEAKLQRRGGRYQLIVGQEKFLKFSEEDIPKVYQYCRDKFLDVIAKHEAKVQMVKTFLDGLAAAGVTLVALSSRNLPTDNDPLDAMLRQSELLASAELKTIDPVRELPDFLPYVRMDTYTNSEIVAMIPNKIQQYFDGLTQDLKLPRVALPAVHESDPQKAVQATLDLNQKAAETLKDLSAKWEAQRAAQTDSAALVSRIKETAGTPVGVSLHATTEAYKVMVQVDFSSTLTEDEARQMLGRLLTLQQDFEVKSSGRRFM